MLVLVRIACDSLFFIMYNSSIKPFRCVADIVLVPHIAPPGTQTMASGVAGESGSATGVEQLQLLYGEALAEQTDLKQKLASVRTRVVFSKMPSVSSS